jgi:urate oxidase
MPELLFNTYGKTGVRLTQVLRDGEKHSLVELSVNILLQGDLAESYTAADNSKVLATDTMKNTVYIVARQQPIVSIETFAADLATHHLARLPHVHQVSIDIEQRPWERIGAHPAAFLGGGAERNSVRLMATRQQYSARSGFTGLEILKTAHSGFSGFLRDEYTTLPETSDRLLGTVLDADWTYGEPVSDYNGKRAEIRALLLECFAGHHSLSVQHTLYAMGEYVLSRRPEVCEIHLRMPNKHRLLFDLSRFGLDNPNQLFVPVDEPSGYIEATLRSK